MKNSSPHFSAEQFHHGDAPVFTGTDPQFKRDAEISRVSYQAAHHNPTAPSDQQGSGALVGKWLYCEEPDKAEGLLKSGVELFMDSHLAPHAVIGLHQHHDTEELYYVLEGSLTITLYDQQQQRCVELLPGDCHCILCGQAHAVSAGEHGARFMVVAAKVATKAPNQA